MDAIELATIVGNLAIALSVVVAVVVGIAQARAAARDRKDRLAMEAIRSFQTREFAEHMHHLRIAEPPRTAQEFYALPSAEQVTFIQFAQQVEMLGLQVAEGAIDLDLVERTLGDFIGSAWGKYEAALRDLRRTIPDPYLGEYFEWLAFRLQQHMRERPRVPMHETVAVAA